MISEVDDLVEKPEKEEDDDLIETDLLGLYEFYIARRDVEESIQILTKNNFQFTHRYPSAEYGEDLNKGKFEDDSDGDDSLTRKNQKFGPEDVSHAEVFDIEGIKGQQGISRDQAFKQAQEILRVAGINPYLGEIRLSSQTKVVGET